MNVLITDITKGISWSEDSFFFNPKDNLNNAELNLIDYLNDASLENIDKDIEIITSLNQAIESSSSQIIERFIMNELNGFMQYEDGIYAFITGSTDKSPSVIFDLNNTLFIIHPNLSFNDKFSIKPLNLIELLNNKKSFLKAIFSNKIQGK